MQHILFAIRAIAHAAAKAVQISAVGHTINRPYAFSKAKMLVPFFYYVIFFIAFSKLEGLNYAIAHPPDIFLPRWPIFWALYTGYSGAATIIFVAFVFSALIGAYLYRVRTARIIALVGMLQYHAFLSSLGGPNHQYDLWVWAALLFVFLPDAWGVHNQTPETRKKFLLVFWGAQAFVLLTYSMSGIGKVYGALVQLLHGEAHGFSIDAAALHISSLLYAMQETTVLGPLIVQFPILGWLPFVGVIYLELCSFFIAFRPGLHRTWAFALILFHIGTYLTMRAIFAAPTILLLILFFTSPFAKPNVSWRKQIYELPFLGPLLKFIF